MNSYLILHKVRGEAAYDIAEKITIGDEVGWIIPTSGHRAYPLENWQLESLLGCTIVDCDLASVRDHYEVMATSPKKTVANIMALLPTAKIRRL